jgi:hypothetical protein
MFGLGFFSQNREPCIFFGKRKLRLVSTAKNFLRTQEREWKIRMSTEAVTVELSTKLTDEQVTLWRQAITKAAPEEDVNKSARAFFKSLRASGTRYTIRQLGRD